MAIIDKPSDYFNTKLYTGNSSTQSITGVGFQPDWTWIKGRSGTYGVSNHKVYDVVRGATKTLFTNLTNAESTQTNTLTSFDSDGFSLGNDTNVNASSTTYASWSWLAGGTASSNTDGSITSSVSANQDAGFSIVSYTGNGTTVSTVGHGLGVKPSMIIVKNRTTAGKQWTVYTSYGTATSHLYLQSTQGFGTYSGYWNNTEPTNNVFTIGNDENNFVNGSTNNFIAYCFAEKQGYSKIGNYTGNGSTDGTFTYTGFKPAFLLTKKTTGGNWQLWDNKRDTINPNSTVVLPNATNADITTSTLDTDFLSNGFKQRNTDADRNASGITVIYMAFAENPFTTSTGVPTTAR